MLKYKYIFQIKHGSNLIKQHSETVMFEMGEMLIAVLKNKCIVPFIIIFGTLSFPINVYRVLYAYPSIQNGHIMLHFLPSDRIAYAAAIAAVEPIAHRN